MRSRQPSSELPNPPMSLTDLLPKLLVGFGPAKYDLLARNAWLSKAGQGDIVMREGEVGKTVCHVIKGTLGMVQTSGEGKAHVIGLLLPGDAFGRIFDGEMPYSVEALTDAVILNIDREVFETALRETPAAEHALIVSMIDELDAARAWALVLSSARVIERIAAFLSILVRRQQPHGGKWPTGPLTLLLPLSRKELARSLGVRAESLSRAIHGLAENGIIEVVSASTLRVLDTEALFEASGGASETGGRNGSGVASAHRPSA